MTTKAIGVHWIDRPSRIRMANRMHMVISAHALFPLWPRELPLICILPLPTCTAILRQLPAKMLVDKQSPPFNVEYLHQYQLHSCRSLEKPLETLKKRDI